MRVLRAFFTALKMTLRGESATPAHLRPLQAWVDACSEYLSTVLQAADAQGMDTAKRGAIKLKLDGRMTSLEQSLQMLRHNLVNEYPRLIRLDDAQAIMVVQASNVNDQYRVSRFLADDAIGSADVRRSLQALDAHLLALPSIEFPQTDA